jgi:hypothetical protein
VRRRGRCACTGATSMHCARPPRACFQYSRLRPKISETELWVSLPTGAEIRLFGADNPDALRGGLYLDGCVTGLMAPGTSPVGVERHSRKARFYRGMAVA